MSMTSEAQFFFSFINTIFFKKVIYHCWITRTLYFFFTWCTGAFSGGKVKSHVRRRKKSGHQYTATDRQCSTARNTIYIHSLPYFGNCTTPPSHPHIHPPTTSSLTLFSRRDAYDYEYETSSGQTNEIGTFSSEILFSYWNKSKECISSSLILSLYHYHHYCHPSLSTVHIPTIGIILLNRQRFCLLGYNLTRVQVILWRQ